MIHPPHLTLYAIVAVSTCGASLVFLVFVSLYSIVRALVPLMCWRTGRRAAGSATRKSSSPHYGGNQRIDFRELSAADFEAFWGVRALSMPIANGRRERCRRRRSLSRETIVT
jgi:hypothetical protein